MEFGGNYETLYLPNIQPQSDLCKEVNMDIDNKIDKSDEICDFKQSTRVSRSKW